MVSALLIGMSKLMSKDQSDRAGAIWQALAFDMRESRAGTGWPATADLAACPEYVE